MLHLRNNASVGNAEHETHCLNGRRDSRVYGVVYNFMSRDTTEDVAEVRGEIALLNWVEVARNVRVDRLSTRSRAALPQKQS